MSRLKSFFRKPISAALFIFGATFVFYLLLSRPNVQVQDFELSGGYAYLAVNRMGLQVINTQSQKSTSQVDLNDTQSGDQAADKKEVIPIQFSETAFFRCNLPFRQANRLQYNFFNCINHPQSIFIQDQYLYVAAGRDGLWLFDISDPEVPKAISQEPLRGPANDVVVAGNLAYVATGKAGLQTVKIILPAPDYEHKPGNLNNDFLDAPENALIKENVDSVFLNGQSLYWVDNRDQLHYLNIANSDEIDDVIVPGFDRKTFKEKIFDIQFSEDLAFISAGKAGLLVRSTSDPAALTSVGEFSPGGITRSFDYSGNHAYLAVEDIGLMILDITDPANIRQVKEAVSTNGTPTKVRRQGWITYLSAGNDGFFAYDANVTINTETLGRTGQQMTVYNLTKAGDYAYLASGDRGLRIVDVRNPAALQETGFVDTNGRTNAVEVQGNLAYLADGPNGIVIADITNPYGRINALAQLKTEQAKDIAVSQNYAYVADTTQGLLVIDVSQSTTPTLLKQMDPVNGTTITPNSVTVFGDYAYLADGDLGVRIVDIRDATIPTQIAQYPTSGSAMDARDVAVIAYNEQALSNPGQDPFVVDPRDPNAKIYAYVANGKQGLLVLDVTKPQSQVPIPLSLEAGIAGLPNSSGTGELVTVQIYRDRAYLAYNQQGIYVLDTSNPASPKLIGMVYLTQSENQVSGLDVEGKTIYAATLTHGLAIFDATQTTQISQIGQYDAPAALQNLAVQGNYTFAVDGSRGLWVYDVSDPRHPVEMTFTPIPGARSVFVADQYAYLACGENGLAILDISNKASPLLLGRLDTPGSANAVHVISRNWDNLLQRIALIADGENGLVVMDVTNPALPITIGGFQQIGQANKLAVWQDYTFVASDPRGLVAINVSDPYFPALMDEIQPAPMTLGVAVDRGFAYVSSGEYGMPIVFVAQPLFMHPVDPVEAGNEWINDVSFMDYYAFQSARENGVKILDTTDVIDPQTRGSWSEKADGSEELEVVQVAPQWIPPNPDDGKPGTIRLYVADIRNGMSILEGTQKAAFKVTGVYETIGAPTLTSLIAYAKSAILGGQYELIKTFVAVQQFFLDFVLLGLVGFFLWVGYLALFVLPLNHFFDWENLYSRILFYLFGQHGPLIRIKEGNALQDLEEKQTLGPGVVLVDSNSAVVLEKRGQPFSGQSDSRLARVASSGLVFTGNRVLLQRQRFDEVVRGIVDLRPQVRIATGVNGYTRDGIEVETVVFSIFTLGEPPDVLNVAYGVEQPTGDDLINSDTSDNPYSRLRVIYFKQKSKGVLEVKELNDEIDNEDKQEIHNCIQVGASMFPWRKIENDRTIEQKRNGAPFTVDPVRVFQATYAQADDMPENKQLDWSELPSYVAIEIFRNLLAREIYDHMYEPLLGNQVYPIKELKTKLRIGTRNQGVLAYRFIRKLDATPFEKGQEVREDELLSSEAQILHGTKVLRSRGIKIKFAGFSELTPVDDAVRDRFLDHWRANREREAAITLAGLEKMKLELGNQWRLEAQQEIIKEFSSLLQSNDISQEVLAMHVLQALEMAADDPDTRRLMPQQTIEMLRNIHTWLPH